MISDKYEGKTHKTGRCEHKRNNIYEFLLLNTERQSYSSQNAAGTHIILSKPVVRTEGRKEVRKS